MHDAFGYITSFHRLGPGYNYLKTCHLFSTKSPLCCQLQGWAKSKRIMDRWHMRSKRGRLRRKKFMELVEKIPTLQSHVELEDRRASIAHRHTVRVGEEAKQLLLTPNSSRALSFYEEDED